MVYVFQPLWSLLSDAVVYPYLEPQLKLVGHSFTDPETRVEVRQTFRRVSNPDYSRPTTDKNIT